MAGKWSVVGEGPIAAGVEFFRYGQPDDDGSRVEYWRNPDMGTISKHVTTIALNEGGEPERYYVDKGTVVFGVFSANRDDSDYCGL